MRLTHVVPHINEEASGPTYAVPRLCQSLADCGHEVELSCLAAKTAIPGINLDLHAQWRFPSRFAVSPSLAKSLYRKADHVDIIHNHSLWSMVNVAAGCVVPGRHAKLITSPHGTLSPWALNRSRYIKSLLAPLQWMALERADLLHATSEAEYFQIRDLGFKAPVALIPNGIDLPPMRTREHIPELRTLLFLSRIHPTKGIDRLLSAWKQLQDKFPDWQLVIAGGGEPEHVQDVRRLARSLKVNRVSFPGLVYGEEKSQLYAHADLFILPTHSENFGMVVAEALAHGCPAIVSQGAPWSGLKSEECGWWVSHDIETLTETLESAMQMPVSQLRAMGLQGRAWMERDFNWSTIGQQMDAAYRWLLNGGSCPTWVKQD